jgi:uncharacterized protein (UPF0147 family)
VSTHRLIQQAKISANRMYGHLEDLREILLELSNDENINIHERCALYECLQALNEVELLDEIVARLGCIDLDGDDE